MKNIYISGSIAYDEIMDFPGTFQDHFHPEKLHQINVSFVVNKLAKHLGGCATNIAYNLRKSLDYISPSSPTPIHLLAAVGKDGNDFLSFFKMNSIDASSVLVDDSQYTATGKVITDIKNNQIWGYYYGACSTAKKIALPKGVTKDDFIVLSATHTDPFLHFQNQAIERGIPYLYDPGMVLTWISDSDLRTGVMHAQYLVGNDYEIGMIEKRLNMTVKEMTAKGISVITTLGEKGAQFDSMSGFITIPAIKVGKVVDPTGAGDAWRGGFVAGLAAGYSIKDSLILGNVMGSFAVETVGTVEHTPSKKEIEERIRRLKS